MVDTVQNEQAGGQLIDNQAAIQKNALAIEQTLSQMGIQGGGGGGGAAGGPKSDVAEVLESTAMKSVTAKAGPIGSMFVTAMTDISDSSRRGGAEGMFGGNKRDRAIQSKYSGSDGFMPSSYSERSAMAKDARRPSKAETAERKLAAQINGATSTVAGHSYAHGNSSVIAGGAKISGASISALSAAPAILSDPVLKQYQDNIVTAKNNLNSPSWARINEGLAQGHANMEQLANQETPEQQRMRMGQASQSYKVMVAEEQNDFAASRGPSAPKPPGEMR
ncbi:MAG TPA: hypothetical protein DIW20_01665 [Rhodospirillaceae bacterium]|nr:hypothetical protein [Rhodospirillaceae bacterium]